MSESNYKLYFILYANCIPVKGAARSTICDLQRRTFIYIPNDLYDILALTKAKTLGEIYLLFGEENREVLDEYFTFLIERELGFIDDDPFTLPSLGLEWDFPSKITNSIIDINAHTFDGINYKNIIGELSLLNCMCIQIRSFEPIDDSKIDQLLAHTLQTRIREIKLLIVYQDRFFQGIEAFLRKNRRVSEIIFTESPFQKSEQILGVNCIFRKKNLTQNNCGTICRSGFSVNIHHFTEALKYNTCLNRKISVDINGEIKNCPSQSVSFGNVSNKSILDIALNENFQELWTIKKDDINICQDCEHRYICTDCRIFTENRNDNLSKPAKCSYDPYNAVWH